MSLVDRPVSGFSWSWSSAGLGHSGYSQRLSKSVSARQRAKPFCGSAFSAQCWAGSRSLSCAETRYWREYWALPDTSVGLRAVVRGVQALTEAARLTNQPTRQGVSGDWEADPNGTPLPIDWAAFVTEALAGAAANIGGTTEILAGRPGSWDAANVREVLESTVGVDDESLWEHRTEPVTVSPLGGEHPARPRRRHARAARRRAHRVVTNARMRSPNPRRRRLHASIRLACRSRLDQSPEKSPLSKNSTPSSPRARPHRASWQNKPPLPKSTNCAVSQPFWWHCQVGDWCGRSG